MLLCRGPTLSLVVLLALGFSSAEHEKVVDEVLQRLSKDSVQLQTEAKDYIYSFKKRLGPMDTLFKVSLYLGKLFIEGVERNGTVEYAHDKEEDPAHFSYPAKLKTFVAYRYTFSASGSTISSGTVALTWISTMKSEMEVSNEDCLIKLVTSKRITEVFDLDVKPNENSFFFPVTIHVPSGNALEKHLQAGLQESLDKSFIGKKLCQCVNC